MNYIINVGTLTQIKYDIYSMLPYFMLIRSEIKIYSDNS